MDNTPLVKVVDSIMGSGKTSWAIQYMNAHPDNPIIYVTPNLTEVDRIIAACPRLEFMQPQQRGKGKLDSFNNLLIEGENIVTTHVTFSNSTDETMQYIREGHYTLILDEVIDVIEDFYTATGSKLKRNDPQYLLDTKQIAVDEYGQVSWIGSPCNDTLYEDVERLAKDGTLFCLGGKMLVWQLPDKIFRLFDEVYVLTYLFQGSYLKPYFEYHSIEYTKLSVGKDVNGYKLIQWDDGASYRQEYKKLINIYRADTQYRLGKLSSSWFDRNLGNDEIMKELKNSLYNFFQNYAHAKAKDILWTTYGKAYDKLKGNGYRYVKRLSKKDKEKLKPKEVAQLERKYACFIPCNARATNDFSDRSVLAYALNFYPNPLYENYFSNKNKPGELDIHVDAEYVALSTMLQWLWRSCIRNNEPITVYIPSARMLSLLEKWLDGKM